MEEAQGCGLIQNRFMHCPDGKLLVPSIGFLSSATLVLTQLYDVKIFFFSGYDAVEINRIFWVFPF